MWDEAGIGIGHKSFQSTQNKVIGWTVQTFRNLQQIVFFTVPSLNFLDATVRKMFHFYIEAVAVDRKKKLCLMKPLILQYNTRMDKIYYHNFGMQGSDGFYVEVDLMTVPKISDELEKKYELIKNKFTDDLNSEIILELDRVDMKSKGNVLDKLTPRQTEIYELIKEGETNKNIIAEKVGCAVQTVYQNLDYMRRKGLNIDKMLKKTPFKEFSSDITEPST